MSRGINGYVFYFVDTSSFTRNHRDCLKTIIIESKHLTTFQVFNVSSTNSEQCKLCVNCS